MTVPRTVASQGGAWDCTLQIKNTNLSDVKIMGFLIDGNPIQSQINNVAPAFRVGGAAAYNSDTFEQAVMDGFSTGGDREIFESGDKRYRHSDGNVATYMENYLTLDGLWIEEDADVVATARQIVDLSTASGDYICVGVGKKLRKFTDATALWSDEGTFGKDATYLFATDQYLFVATPGEDFHRWDGTPTTGWAQPAAGKDYDGFCWHNDTLYAFVGNQIVPATNNNGSAWGTEVDVGWDATNISHIFSDGYFLYIAKPEGFYYYDGTNVRQVIDATETRSADNFNGGCSWRGAVYLPWGLSMHKAIVRSTGVTVTEIPMTMYGDTAKERYGHGEPIRCFAGPDRIFIATDDEQGLYPSVIYHNDIGMHGAYRGASGDTMRAAGYSRLRDWILINDGSTRIRYVSTNGIRPFPNYAASGWVSTPWFDAGYPDEFKAWRDITLELEDVDEDNTVAVYYDDDETGWTLVDTLTTEGKNTLTLGGTQGIVSARKISFKLTLTRDSSDTTKTPKIKYPIIVRGMVTPSATDGFETVLYLDEKEKLWNSAGVVGDAYTYDGAINFLEEMKDSRYPVVYTDINGRQHLVKITSVDYLPKMLPNTNDKFAEVYIRSKSLYNGVDIQEKVSLEVSAASTFSTFTWEDSSYFGERYFGTFYWGA